MSFLLLSRSLVFSLPPHGEVVGALLFLRGGFFVDAKPDDIRVIRGKEDTYLALLDLQIDLPQTPLSLA